jgi:CHAD domain-containing protein
MVLTYGAYNETLEKQQEKDTELHDFKERISKMENILVAIQPLLQQVKPEMISKLEVIEREKY